MPSSLKETTYIEYFRCNQCATVWLHVWDVEDYNNDFTQCPNCEDFEFDEITEQQYEEAKK